MQQYTTPTIRLAMSKDITFADEVFVTFGTRGKKFMTKTGDEWDELFDKAGITGGKIKDLNDVLKDPAAHSRNATVKMEVPGYGPVSFSGFPINMSGEEFEFTPPPAVVGQDTAEVLSSVLGMTDEEIEAYHAAGN